MNASQISSLPSQLQSMRALRSTDVKHELPLLMMSVEKTTHQIKLSKKIVVFKSRVMSFILHVARKAEQRSRWTDDMTDHAVGYDIIGFARVGGDDVIA